MTTEANADPSVLLDLSKPFDEAKVRLLDAVVGVMYGGNGNERQMAHHVLNELKAKPDAWCVVKEILTYSSEANTKFFALSMVETCIQYRWKILTMEQKTFIKQCVTQMAVECATNPSLASQKHLVSKVNATLVQLVKQEWPHGWPTFIPEMCTAAKTNQQICQSVVDIFCIMSEAVFEFGEDELTSQKVKDLMINMTSQFQQIYELCIFIIQNYINSPRSVDASLVTSTLKCLSHFLKWIPYGFIFQTQLIELIIDNFWDPPAYRVECLRCLSEIVILKEEKGDAELAQLQVSKLRDLWLKIVSKCSNLPEQTLCYEEEKNVPANSRLFWEMFYQQLALLLTGFLKTHRMTVLEEIAKQPGHADTVTLPLGLLVRMSRIQHDATFKICLEFWLQFTKELWMEAQNNCRAAQSCGPLAAGVASMVLMNLAEDESPGVENSMTDQSEQVPSVEPIENAAMYSERLGHYQSVLQALRRVMVSRMAKPQEVYVCYDEETQTVDRDYQPDTDEISMYNMMRQVLIFLSNLSGSNTQEIMEEVLNSQIQGHDGATPWNPMPLNRLCWSIGAISGSMTPSRERSFLINVIRELLTLCEVKRGKENKAIVASQLMYIVGQYPRFLNLHWKFLQVLLKKLFDFMKDRFPGVQDMACETLLKVCQKCKTKIAMHPDDQMSSVTRSAPVAESDLHASRPYVESIILHVPEMQAELETTKLQLMVFEAVGHCIASSSPQSKSTYIETLLDPCNRKWARIIQGALTDPESLLSLESSRAVTEILRLNERIAFATGTVYSAQFNRLYGDMLKIYQVYSSQISEQVQFSGAQVMGHTKVKQLRAAKRESLRLIETFVNASVNEDQSTREEIKANILPLLLQPVLQDYMSNVPQAKDYEVLLLLSSLMKRLDVLMINDVALIFECIFDCTLEMIKHDFHSFPDIRTSFYDFLLSCVANCFDGLFHLPDKSLQNFVDSLVWGFKHEQPAVAEQGLQISLKFIEGILARKPEVIQAFFGRFYFVFLNEVVGVLTDTLHKSGFRNQTVMLQQLILVVDSGVVDDSVAGITKAQVRERLGVLLLNNFLNLNPKQIETFVYELFNLCDRLPAFQTHVRDFLVQLKEFAGSDEAFELERQDALRRTKIREEQQVGAVVVAVRRRSILNSFLSVRFQECGPNGKCRKTEMN